MTSPRPFDDRASTGALTVAPADAGAGRVVLMVTGEVDMATADELALALADLLRRRPLHRLLVDLAGVRFLDSSGIRTLLEAAQDAQHRGCHLVLVNTPRNVRRVLEIAGVATVLGLDAAGDGHLGAVSSPDSAR
ncbi:STAS domain-containing protein [Micromonospora sp. NPDC051141]|uniref:STAS domain-containing protein n=1 Tax=Micromonospora sp. NPDC051141 TaxID=3364284 RepID=UPI0037AEC999